MSNSAPIVVISTVGSSIFNSFDEHTRELARQFRQSDERPQDIIEVKRGFPGEALYDRVMKMLEAHLDDPAEIQRKSAEFKSLSRILEGRSATANDRLVFLATDTPDGALAARIIADFCEMYFERDTDPHLIPGLQVHDGDRFRRTGLRAFISQVYNYLDDSQFPPATYERVLNPTGGFKGVVPYLTIIGMLNEDVSVTYIFEFSDALIRLGRLPLSLDFDSLRSITPALKKLDAEDMLAEADLQQALAWQRPLSEHPAWSLFEDETIDGTRYYTLSGLGQIALETLAQPTEQPVYLSKEANEVYNQTKPGSEARRMFQKILNDIASPGLRQTNDHSEVTNAAGASCYKIGRTPYRAFWLHDDDGILVIELAVEQDNGQYDRMPAARKHYERLRLWTRTDR